MFSLLRRHPACVDSIELCESNSGYNLNGQHSIYMSDMSGKGARRSLLISLLPMQAVLIEVAQFIASHCVYHRQHAVTAQAEVVGTHS